MNKSKIIINPIDYEEFIKKVNIKCTIDKKNKKFFYTAFFPLNGKTFEEKMFFDYQTLLTNIDDKLDIDEFAYNALITQVIRNIEKGNYKK